jgi:hypothetical protein
MKRIVLAILMIALMSGSAFAQDPDNPFNNNIGIYLNAAATGSCGAIGEDIPFTAYVILTRLTNPEVWGWEAKFVYDNILSLGVNVYGDHINAGTRPGEQIVGYSNPMVAVNGNLVVAEMDLIVSGFFNDVSLESNVFIEGIFFNLLPNEQPAYLSASGGGGVALWQAIGGNEDAQLSMNCGCAPVATEESTWGTLKSLYR